MDINSFFILRIDYIEKFENLINYKENNKIVKLEYKETIENKLQKYKYTSISYNDLEITDYEEAELIKIEGNRIIVFVETENMAKKIQQDLEKLLKSNVNIEKIDLENFTKENNNIKINKYLVKDNDMYFIDADLIKNYNKIKEKTVGLQMILKIKNRFISVIILNKKKVKFAYGLVENEVIDMCRGLRIIA